MIKLRKGSYLLSESNDRSPFLETLGTDALVTAEEIETDMLDRNFSHIEQIGKDLLCTVSKTLKRNQLNSEADRTQTGLSFGSICGCVEELIETDRKIACKAEKGIKPKEATNNILCGACAKVAIKHGLKSFNYTNFNSSNAGMDALLYACDILLENRSVYAIAAAGDEQKAYASLLLQTCSTLESEAVGVTGYTRGLVYGTEKEKQVAFFLQKIRKTMPCSEVDSIRILCDTEEDMTFLVECCKKYAFCSEPHAIFPYVSPTPDAAAGILSILQIQKQLEEQAGSVLQIQFSKDAYFSCILLERK